MGLDFVILFWMVTVGHRTVPDGLGSDFRGWRYSTTSFLVVRPAAVVTTTTYIPLG